MNDEEFMNEKEVQNETQYYEKIWIKFFSQLIGKDLAQFSIHRELEIEKRKCLLDKATEDADVMFLNFIQHRKKIRELRLLAFK